MRNLFVNVFDIGPAVQEMSFKAISYLELWLPFCSVECNNLCNIGRGHHEKHVCKITLNLVQWSKRRGHLKLFHTYMYN